MRSLLVRTALGLALTTPPSLAAQTLPDTAKPRVYSSLRIRLSGAQNVNREQLHEFWRARTGAGIGVTTPFYVGSVGVGATLIPFRSRESGRPNFRALMLGVDWGADIPVPEPFRVRAAARVGDFVMLIENPDLWLDSESELFTGGEVSAALAVWRGLGVAIAGSYARVHTRPALDLALVTLGLEYAARTPGWLRAILE
jgi:hypothetical protein